MQREAAAIVLLIAQAVGAQCMASAPAPTQAQAQATQQVTATAQRVQQPRVHAHPQQEQRSGKGLIKTAAAGTRDDVPPVVRDAVAHHPGDDDHPRRGGTAMLLSALALMSGIALRRFGRNA